jgi:hypothetical protein
MSWALCLSTPTETFFSGNEDHAPLKKKKKKKKKIFFLLKCMII